MLLSPAFRTVSGIVGFVDATVIPLTTLVTGLLRQGLAEKRKDEYLTAFLRGYSSITRETLEGVDSIYDTIRANLNQQLDAYYQFQVDGMLDAVQQVKGLLVKGDTGVDDIRSRSQAMIAGVDEMRLLLPNSSAGQ
jgi:anionic cell wall polymer biosynthesis LytR-Cps2A-Psr (LCP) family protein